MSKPFSSVKTFYHHCVYTTIVIFLAILTAGPAFAAQTELFLSPTGNDSNPGTKAQPLKTLQAARDAARKLKTDQKVIISLEQGIYNLTEPLILTSQDSGCQENPMLYRASSANKAIISGGVCLDNFQNITDETVKNRLTPQAQQNVLQADLKPLKIKDYGSVKDISLDLFFRDNPMTLARWPNEGFTNIKDLVEPGTMTIHGRTGSATGKFFYEGDQPKRWLGEKDPWVHGYWFWDWSDQKHPIESIDTEKRIISVKPPYHNYGYLKGQWFYAMNILAELDLPGEWYLDRQDEILYFWPPEKIEPGQTVVSIAKSLIEMTDASNITFQGLTFQTCQATAITIKGGSQNYIDNCAFRNLGSYAVNISDAADSSVTNCHIYNVGDGGIYLTGGDRKSLTPANLLAENNHVHNYGRRNPMYKAAIHLYGVGNRAAHNLIHDAPHTAIFFQGNDHIIEFNEIHNVCLESNDAGAIYAGRNWTDRGTIVRHNYLHNISGFRNEGCVGVYLDDMFCGTTIFGNVFYKVYRAAFIGGGRDCTVENNLFVDCDKAMFVDARALGWAKSCADTTMTERLEEVPYKSALWQSRYPQLPNILQDEPNAPKGNLIIRNIFVGEKWNDIQAQAQPYITLTDNLLNEDPHFAGTPPQNFQLKEDSPAWKLGFKKIPFEKIGLKNKN